MPEPIAIVGIGCRFPGGASSPSALWELLESPRDVCNDIPKDRFDITGYYHRDGSHHATTNVRQAYLLREDFRLFDAAFFNISPNEADSIDPQQRLLLETVYEALEAGGHTVESLRGSDTAVYVGTMGVDYNDTLLRDVNTLPTYFATGTNRAIISNRVSYFFDWHGPSMTIDTACSSSLIAVHQGVQALRTGESRLAVACGTQVILGPEAFVFESKMQMLSPTGRSRMWDADADGYARGEGVAAVVLKRLSDAIADGDHIEAILRNTGANQDGHSTGLTVPSSEAQAALIRETYRKAQLDVVNNPYDGPQFFEAHGTGTKAGDPKEAAAIQECFGGSVTNDAPLYVGSVKTVIGHTEGAAGLAGVLKAVGIIQKGIIPPNLLFNRLNPAIEQHYNGLHVPTTVKPWPKLPEGVPRRVSVNSFGFGGSNAHAILEEYSKNPTDTTVSSLLNTPFTPFVFSAASEASLVAQLQAYSERLKTLNDINPSDLAWTLQSRKSQLPIKTAFAALTIEQLISNIDKKLEEVSLDFGKSVGIRSLKSDTFRILGIFTGQGAQWAAMGAELIRSSVFVCKRVQHLEESLATLPPSDRPEWSLREQMVAGADTSQITKAELSQPLCTAVQIILVDLLKTAGIAFTAVVGHSSGEIGAAYASGFLSARDAIRVAYYRGLHAPLAGSTTTGQKGAMLAVGTSLEDARELINMQTLKGRLAIAAHNSSANVTLSGDVDAIVIAKKVFDEEKKFTRLLKVDTAYHSHHMLPCGDPYINSLRACNVQVNQEQRNDCSWFSSVIPDNKAMKAFEGLQDVYWRDNMESTVLFADAIKNAIANNPQLTLALEVGPHPALKGPATQNIADMRSDALPYFGLLSRGKNDVEAFAEGLGSIWAYLGAQGVDFEAYRKTMAVTGAPEPKLVTGLPSYQWNHGRSHWTESRRSRKILRQKQAFHELLGVLSADSTNRDMRWSNLLKISEIPWLQGHQLQGQTVFPAAGYVAMGLEAARSLAGGRSVELFELHTLDISKAITFDEEANSTIETLITLTAITTPSQEDQTITADLSIYSCSSIRSDQEMELTASCSVKIVFGRPDVKALSSTPLELTNMSEIDEERFYSKLLAFGYGYSGPFRGMSSLKRKLNQASVRVETYPYTDADCTLYMVHPAMLDVAFQSSILAYSAPGDGRLWSLHVPTAIRSIRVNPELCASLPISGSRVTTCAVLGASENFAASIDVFGDDGQHAMIQVEGLTIKPFAPATEADDHCLFSYTKYDVAIPDGTSVVGNIRPSVGEIELATACERIAYYYLRKWKSELTEDEWVNGQAHHPRLRDFMDYTLSTVTRNEHPFVKKEWSGDTAEQIAALTNQYPENIDIRLLTAVGENIPAAVRGQTTILEHMLRDNMLDDFYKKGLGFMRYNAFLASVMKQMVHRYPHARILEIGAGTGGCTKSVLENIGDTISSYTYTDVSVGFFDKAAELFKAYRDKMSFKVLDVEQEPSTQGFEPHSYDFLIASNVLHATSSLQRTLDNTRRLLKPGGYLMLLELTDNGPIRCGNIMGGLPGWWVGADDGRRYAPTITTREWHTALRRSGFSGVDAVTPKVDVLPWPFSIMATQAVDDRVQFLRRPLSCPSTSIYLDSVIILGGASLEISRIAEEVADLIRNFCGQVTILSGLPTETEALTLNPMSTFINLVDLDTPIFKSMTAERMAALKRLYELAKHILWITAGALDDEPYHMASITFSRAISHEAGHISLNHLDVSHLDHNVPKAIAEHLLRQSALDKWEVSKDFLWSKEPEVFLKGGQLMIPRLVANVSQNARLNSSRRVITKTLPISSSNVSIMRSDGLPSVVEEVLPMSLNHAQSPFKVKSSSLKAIQITAETFLFLGVDEDNVTKETTVVLSMTNSSAMIPIASAAAGTTQSADNLLIAVASELLAMSLIQALPTGSSVLVHGSGKDCFLAAALSRRSAAKAIKVTFTCDVKSTDGMQESTWILLSARAPRYAIQELLLPTKATHFLDLTAYSRTHLNELSDSIAQVLPSGYKKIDASDISRHESFLCPSANQEILVDRLADAVRSVRAAGASTASKQVQDLVIPLDKIRDQVVPNNTMSVVHWPSDGDIKVDVLPLDGRRLFSKEKTYLLVGLTGQIGQSLCEWMAYNGAGCVCLASRSPQISNKWLQSFEGKETTVRVFAMDITDKASLERVVNEIRACCPPIAGVANGAMVLHDSLFSGMSLEVMQKVLQPKIEGSYNLDQLFFDDDLDFFVLFSSSACVIGNSGQSNYSASNGYLNSLARQRRKRGLAASAFDIGRVAGIGYVETAGQAVMDQLTRFGLMAISETEFHQMFAETIRAGYPSLKEEAVVTTGIRTIYDNEEIQGPWFENPRFSHCIVGATRTKADAGQQTKTTLPVSEQLSQATTSLQALEILQESFSAKLRIVLQISDQDIPHDAPLVELGVDSLVAVEVRSWFLKELKVDIPVLQVVGGASIAELSQRALGKLSEELLANIGSEKQVSKSAVAQPKDAKSATRSAESTSASDSDSTTPSVLTTDADSTFPTSAHSSVKLNSFENGADLSQLGAPVVEQSARKCIKSEQMSFGQSRFWFLRLLLEDQTAFNVAFYYQVTGNLRIGDMERAIRIVSARHEALRTCFTADESEVDQAYQNVMGSSSLRLEYKKIKSVDEVAMEYDKLKAHVFDLTSAEMLRVLVLTLSPSSHYLLVNYHHIIMDGVSFQVFLSDLEKAYNGQPLGCSPRQFPDFSAAQRKAFENGDMCDELRYWQKVFPAGEQPPVLPMLPIARSSSRLSMTNFDVHQVKCRLSPELAGRVKAACKAQRSTPFHFYLAAFKSMLFCFTDVQDLTIGIADANRNDSDVLNSIGFFLNLLTLRFRRQPEQTFADAIAEAREITYAALKNSRLPFDILLKELNVTRSSTHSPFFQTFFDYRQGAQEKHTWGNCQFVVKELHPGRTAYDITLDVTDNTTNALIMFRTQKSLYDLTATNLLLETYIHMLEILSRDVSLPLKATPLFSEKQLTAATQIGRGPKLLSDWPATLPHRIDEVAHENRDKIALIDCGTGHSLTYSAMTDRIEAISEALQNAGIGAASRVLVFQQAASDWICSMLAIMRVGGIYVPLDLRNPLPRLAAVASDCKPEAVLTDESNFEDVPQLNIAPAVIINVSHVRPRPSTSIPNVAKPDSPAAILYTSGSTGTPKGIIVTHAGLRNEIEGYTKMWKLSTERVLQQSAYTFNHSSDQIYTGLVNGGTIYTVPWSQRGDPLSITKIIQESSITYTKATPSEYSLWMQYGGDNLRQASTWRFAFGGGEPMTSTLTQEFADLHLSQLRVFNSYGPTEISISSTKMEIEYRNQALIADARIPCGFSLPNYSTYIMSEDLKPLPAGMPGEVYIGGAGVSLGYLNNRELTSQHFIPNPFASAQDTANGWTRMYRTGDIGHLQEDGAMAFHHRMAGDTQIKIRGLRIELSDIESNIISAAGGALKEAVVTLREGEPEFLIAHVVFASQHDIADKNAFLEHLLGHLSIPQYMLPVAAIPLDQLPLTNHSKVDRKALKNMPLPRRAKSIKEDVNFTETMVQLKRMWLDVLGNKELDFDITPSTSFFLVGGNSLLVIRLQSRIRQVFDIVIPLVELLGANTLGHMARKIEESSSIGLINWEEETATPTIPDFLGDAAEDPIGERTTKKTVLITGGTGFLAKYILPRLASNPEVGVIHCVAVRGKPSEGGDSRRIPFDSPKIVSHSGDLLSPLLGLSEDEFRSMSRQVDVILHMGAVRSFWDHYDAIRPSNVLPTKELVKLAAPCRIPIHYISTVGVLPRGSPVEPVSAANHIPAVDGTNGYIASRWASERILERATVTLKIPTSVYRFLPSADQSSSNQALDEFIRFVDISGMMPDFSGWEGRIDMVPAEQAAHWLCESIEGESGVGAIATQFSHFESPIAVNVSDLKAYIKEQRGDRGFERMPGLRWIGRIKALGFNYFFSSQDATVDSSTGVEGGPKFESRR